MNLKAKIRPALPALRLGAALLLLLAGAYLAVPSRGFSATLPLFPLFALAASFCEKNPRVVLPAAFFAGLLFETALEPEEDKLLRGAVFGLFLLLAAILAFLAAKFAVKKKIAAILFSVLCLAGAAALHLFWNGTPWENLARGKEADAYLAAKYPTQTFTRTVTWRDRKTGVYRTEAEFQSEGNALSALIVWEETPEDGYFDIVAGRACDKALTGFLDALRDRIDASFSAGPIRLSVTAADLAEVKSRPDSILEEEWASRLVVPIELKQQTKKREFDEIAAEVLTLIRESKLEFGELVLLGTSSGQDRYTVRLTPETDPAAIPGLSIALQKELPLKSS